MQSLDPRPQRELFRIRNLEFVDRLASGSAGLAYRREIGDSMLNPGFSGTLQLDGTRTDEGQYGTLCHVQPWSN